MELIKPDIEQLIPELLAAFKPKSCKLVPSPDLNSLSSFFLEISHFGKQIYIVSDSVSLDEAKKQILKENVKLLATKNGFHIFTDDQPSIEVIYLCLIDIIEWKTPLKLILNKLIGNENWEIIYAEKYYFEFKNKIIGNFGLLKGQKEEKEEENNEKKQVEVWLTFVNTKCNIIKKIKKKVLRKVPKKSSTKIINENNNNNSSSNESKEQTPSSQINSNEEINENKDFNKLNLNNQNGHNIILENNINGKDENLNNLLNNNNCSTNNEENKQPIYLEIPVQLSIISPPQIKENEILENGNTKNYEEISVNNNNNNESSPPLNSIGDISSDSPNSLSYVSANNDYLTLSSNNRRSWRREDAPSPSTSLILQNNRRNITSTNQIINGPIHRLVTPLGSNLSPISSCGSVEGQQDLDKDILNKNTVSCTDRSYYDDYEEEEEDDDDESTLMILNKENNNNNNRRIIRRRDINNNNNSIDDGDDLTIMSSIREDISLHDSSKNNKIIRTTRHGKHNIINSNGGFHSSLSPPPRHSTQCRSSTLGSRSALSRSPSTTINSHNLQMVRGMLGTFRMPVPVLQQILGLFSFKEIGLLRRVHPHWDELAGQLLNVAHFKLIQRAQHLLTNCQRRNIKESRMTQPVKLLTRLHVHALNPVDGMRAFMDEGVLCFPYGAFLDKAFALLSLIDEMIENFVDEEKQEYQFNEANNLMEKLAEITNKAIIHYRQFVEPEAEKRMSELYRVSAQQRLQRIDSFLVESSVSRVEREAEKNRNEINWEMEQLKQQNIQLKKESRDLKQICQRFDQRIDILERKFKTMARLLQ